jgi:hypothetical protein
MPSDLRRITFDAAELLEAVVYYDRLADQKLTCGQVVGFKVGADRDRAMSFDLALTETQRRLQIDLHEEYVNAAMMMYCVSNKVPIFPDSDNYFKATERHLKLYSHR